MNTDSTNRSAAIAPGARHAHWLLRLALASVFLYMGVDKFMGGGIGEFSMMMGLPLMLAGTVALGEIATGSLILLGGVMASRLGDLVTRLAALGMILILLGAIFMVHWGQWHFMATPSHPLGGMMFQVTLAMMALYLLARGNND
ncbi:DoxX family protein [Halomonas alkalisoli]|uniref:DoxX family protein n=1 Tax=Halomonas alkalisoli TaxID=2907158 RepID=UPI001F1A3A4F|nr:DoxX family protein [Halomonas alkalisoli]MCE9682505.1 DoxX family protein [Halomonas alkalisoli]